MYTGQEIAMALIMAFLVMVLGDLFFSIAKSGLNGLRVIKSEIEGEEGKISTYNFTIFNAQWYISKSDTKWHLNDKYKRTFIWFSNDDGYPSLYIWKIAIFYETKEMRDKRLKNK